MQRSKFKVLGDYIHGQFRCPEEPQGEWISRSPADFSDELGRFTYSYHSVDESVRVARLALNCGVPVLPVAMIGTREAQPIGQVMPRLFMPITVRIGKPLRFDRLAGRADDPKALRQITDEVMFDLRALSGQDYVDRYAKRKADDGPETAQIASLPVIDDRPLVAAG